jgi:hypothetical protein
MQNSLAFIAPDYCQAHICAQKCEATLCSWDSLMNDSVRFRRLELIRAEGPLGSAAAKEHDDGTLEGRGNASPK